MATNEELVAGAQALVVEGQESEAVTQAVVDFVAAEKAAHDQAVADMQAIIDTLSADQLPADQREALLGFMTTAKGSFDNTQAVLTALVTPPEPSGRKRK